MAVAYNIDGVERFFPDGTSEEEAKKIVESLEKKEEAREKDSEYEGIGQELFEEWTSFSTFVVDELLDLIDHKLEKYQHHLH